MHLDAKPAKGEPHARVSTPGGAVMVLCPGGLEAGGGIGRQMGYFLDAARPGPARIAYRVADTRGPWFLGAAPARKGAAAAYLARCVLTLLAFRVSTGRGIVHVNIAGRGSTLRKLVLCAWMRAIGLGYLIHVHDYDYAADFNARGAWMRARVRNMFHRAERVVVLGHAARAALQDCLYLPPARLSVIHNAVPDPWADGAPRGGRVPRGAGAPCHIVFLGHLSERKGVPELLRALASPELAAATWRATLAGGGAVDDFRRQAAEQGLADRVRLTGWLDQSATRALCADADVLVLPSHAEGLAMSVLEGMAHGLAVVTTPVGAHPEVIEPEVSGLFVPPGEVAPLAAALLRVVQDRALQEKLQAGARRRFVEMFSIRDYARRMGDLHASLLARG
jgi:glycosyltransferase involved in cell wall biosynthesis